MTTYVLILLASLVLVIGVTPLAQRVARRVGMVDKPSARKQHTVPTPLLGGAAIFIAVILALILLGDRFYVNQVVGIALGATLVSFLGLWDDRRGLSPWVKLLGQFLAATVLVMTDVQHQRAALGMGEHRGHAVVGRVHHQRHESARQHGWTQRRGGGDCGTVLFALCGHQQTVPGGRARRSARGRVRRIPVLQSEPGQHLHGRYRQPFPGLHAGGGRHQAALPRQARRLSPGWCRRSCWPCRCSTRAW